MVRSLSHDLSPKPSAPPPPPTPHPLSSRLEKCFCSGMLFFPLNHSEELLPLFVSVCVPCLCNVFIASFFSLVPCASARLKNECKLCIKTEEMHTL